jgi:hypothetical protein
MEDFIRELSSSLLVTQEGTADEFLEIKRTIGDIIARVDALLHDRVRSTNIVCEGFNS